MLPADRGYDLHLGGDDGGGIQPAAQAGLDDGHIAGLFFEIEQSGSRQDLELSERLAGCEAFLQFVGHGADPGYQLTEFVLSGGHGVDHLALSQADQMRGNIGPDLQALRFQHGGDEAGGRTLAVGAHHVDGPVGFLGRAKRLHQLGDALQPKAHAQTLEPVDVLPDLGRIAGVPAGQRRFPSDRGSSPPTRSLYWRRTSASTVSAAARRSRSSGHDGFGRLGQEALVLQLDPGFGRLNVGLLSLVHQALALPVDIHQALEIEQGPDARALDGGEASRRRVLSGR